MFLFSRFIEVDIDTAMQRVLKRHISTGMYSLTLTSYICGKGKIERYGLLQLSVFMFITGKPSDVAKWRVRFTFFEIQNFHFQWILLLNQSQFQGASIMY